MLASVVAIGLLAVTAFAQGPPAPPNTQPGMGPGPGQGQGPGPGPGPGPGQGRGQGSGPNGVFPVLYGAPAPDEPQPSCPSTTDREWICQIHSGYPGGTYTQKDGQSCNDWDLCYLGPVASRPLMQPWTYKWMCGPKPCDVELSGDGILDRDQYVQDCLGPDNTCEDKWYNILVNGTDELRVKFCTYTPQQPHMIDMPDMELESMWAPQLCSVNSSVDDFQSLKDCDNGESCGRGPLHFWHRGTQYRAYLCTKTPQKPMQSNHSEPLKKLWEMHMAMGEIGDALVMKGHVLREGPHQMIYGLGKKLYELKSHIETAEKWDKEMGKKGPFKLPEYAMERLEPIRIQIMLLSDKVINLLGGGEGKRVALPLSRAFMDLLHSVNGGMGEPDIGHLMTWIYEHGEWLLSFINKNDLDNPLAKVAYISTHEAMIELKKKLMDERNNKKAMEVFKNMGMNMGQMWMVMSGGPAMPGVTRATIGNTLKNDLKMLQKELLMMKDPEGQIRNVLDQVDELDQLFRRGMVRSKVAKRAWLMAHEKLSVMYQSVKNIREKEKAMEIMDYAIQFIQQVWFHITDGPLAPESRPETALQGLRDFLWKLKDYLPRGDEPPPPPPNGDGYCRPDEPPQGNNNRGPMQQARDFISGLGERMDGDNGPRRNEGPWPQQRNEGPGPQQRNEGPGPQLGNGDIREVINQIRDSITEAMKKMMDEMSRRMDEGKGDMMGDLGMRGNGDTMGRGMGMSGDMMGMGNEGDMRGGNMRDERPCPEQFWKKQIPPEDKNKYAPTESAFMRPDPPMPNVEK